MPSNCEFIATNSNSVMGELGRVTNNYIYRLRLLNPRPKICKPDKKRRLSDLDLTNQRSGQLRSIFVSGVGSNLQVGGTMRRSKKNLMCPPLFSCASTWGGTTIVCYGLRDKIEVSPSVGSAVCTSTGEVGRGAIHVDLFQNWAPTVAVSSTAAQRCQHSLS